MGPMGKGVIYGAGFLGFGARVLPALLEGRRAARFQGFRDRPGPQQSTAQHMSCMCLCVCVCASK